MGQISRELHDLILVKSDRKTLLVDYGASKKVKDEKVKEARKIVQFREIPRLN